MRKPSVKSTAKKTLAVGWVRDAQATKYVVQYSQNNKFQGKTTKSVTINKNTIGKTTLKVSQAAGTIMYVCAATKWQMARTFMHLPGARL